MDGKERVRGQEAGEPTGSGLEASVNIKYYCRADKTTAGA